MLLSGAPPFNGDSSEKIHHLILVSLAHSWRTKPFLSWVHALLILHATVLCLHTCHFMFNPISTLASTHLNMKWFAFTRFESYHRLVTSSLVTSHHLTFKTLLFALHSLSPVLSLLSLYSFFSSLSHFFLPPCILLQHKEPDYSSKMFPKALDTTIDFLKQVRTYDRMHFTS